MKFVAWTFSFLVLSAAAFADVLRFSEIAGMIRQRNLHVKAAEQGLEASLQRERSLGRSFMPHVDLDLGYEQFQRESFASNSQPFGAVQVQMNLFNGGKDRLEAGIRRQESKGTQAERALVIRDELTRAQSEYWNLAYYKEILSLLESYSARNLQNLAAAKRRISAGFATQSDRIEFEMTHRLIEQDKSKVKVQQVHSRETLNLLVGREPAQDLEVAEALPETVDASLTDFKLDPARIPEVLTVRSELEASALKRDQSARWWIPKLDAYAGFKQMNMRESDEFASSDRQEYFAGAKLSMNIFEGGDALAEKRSLAAKTRSLQSLATHSLGELSVEFGHAKLELLQLGEQVTNTAQDVNLAAQFLSRILGEYSRGVKSSSEVLSASDRSFEFQKRYADLRRDYQISRARLMALVSEEI